MGRNKRSESAFASILVNPGRRIHLPFVAQNFLTSKLLIYQ